MSKADLVDAVIERCKPDDFKYHKSAERAVNAVFDIIKEQLAAGESVTITGFGTFKTVERQERTVNNPQGGSITIPAHTAPKFKASDGFKKLVAK